MSVGPSPDDRPVPDEMQERRYRQGSCTRRPKRAPGRPTLPEFRLPCAVREWPARHPCRRCASSGVEPIAALRLLCHPLTLASARLQKSWADLRFHSPAELCGLFAPASGRAPRPFRNNPGFAPGYAGPHGPGGSTRRARTSNRHRRTRRLQSVGQLPPRLYRLERPIVHFPPGSSRAKLAFC